LEIEGRDEDPNQRRKTKSLEIGGRDKNPGQRSKTRGEYWKLL
jgi:hypothetical protein